MHGIINYESFLITGILINLIPGVDTMYIISRSVSQGKAAGIYSVMGIMTGSLTHTLLVSLGLSIILTKSLLLFNIIKLIGVSYLIYLGITMLLNKKGDKLEVVATKVISIRKIYLQGLLTSLTNPKVALFFVAFLPQFVDKNAASPLSFLLLGGTFTLTGLIWCLFIANFAAYVTKKLRNSPKIKTYLDKLTGAILIAMGIKLFLTKAPK